MKERNGGEDCRKWLDAEKRFNVVIDIMSIKVTKVEEVD